MVQGQVHSAVSHPSCCLVLTCPDTTGGANVGALLPHHPRHPRRLHKPALHLPSQRERAPPPRHLLPRPPGLQLRRAELGARGRHPVQHLHHPVLHAQPAAAAAQVWSVFMATPGCNNPHAATDTLQVLDAGAKLKVRRPTTFYSMHAAPRRRRPRRPRHSRHPAHLHHRECNSPCRGSCRWSDAGCIAVSQASSSIFHWCIAW